MTSGVLADHYGLNVVFYFLAATIVIANLFVFFTLTPERRSPVWPRTHKIPLDIGFSPEAAELLRGSEATLSVESKHGIYNFVFASCFATWRAPLMKSCATGQFRIRFGNGWLCRAEKRGRFVHAAGLGDCQQDIEVVQLNPTTDTISQQHAGPHIA